MGFTNGEQLRELFLCGGMGFLLAAYYDAFRLLRLLWRPKAAGVFFQDILFCVTAAAAVFLFALAVTDGVLRVYLFVGLLAGFFAYRCTVGRLLVSSAARLLRFLSRCGRIFRRRLGAITAPWTAACRGRWQKLREKRKKGRKNCKKISKTS